MTTLAQPVGKQDGVLVMAAAVNVASALPWRFTLDSEVVYVTGASPDGLLLSVDRGGDDTTPATHTAGTALIAAPIPTSGGGGNFLPIANPAGVVINTATYTDPYTGAPMTVLVFPAEQIVAAFAIAGDTFPRVEIISDGSDSAVGFGDGSGDPSTFGEGAWFGYFSGAAKVYGPNGSFLVGSTLLDGHIPAANISSLPIQVDAASGGVTISSGNGNPNSGFGNRAGNAGDIYINLGGGDGSWIWRCTVGGSPATWVAKL